MSFFILISICSRCRRFSFSVGRSSFSMRSLVRFTSRSRTTLVMLCWMAGSMRSNTALTCLQMTKFPRRSSL